MFDNIEHAARMGKRTVTSIDRLNKYEVIAQVSGCHADYVRMIERGARFNSKNELHKKVKQLLNEWEPRTSQFIANWAIETEGGAPCQS